MFRVFEHANTRVGIEGNLGIVLPLWALYRQRESLGCTGLKRSSGAMRL